MKSTRANRMEPATWPALAHAIVGTGIAEKLFEGDPGRRRTVEIDLAEEDDLRAWLQNRAYNRGRSVEEQILHILKARFEEERI